jgi:hypothetical protein
VSTVAFTSRQRATEAALLRRQATVLQGYSRNVVAADNTNAIVSITSQALAALFQVPVVVMLKRMSARMLRPCDHLSCSSYDRNAA